MTIAQHDLEFTRDGAVFDEGQVRTILDGLPALTDLFVVCHGWNNDMAEARALYDGFFASVSAVLGQEAALAERLAGRAFGAVRVFWPSKRFADEALVPGGGAADAADANTAALEALLDRLKRNPARLPEHADGVAPGSDIDPVREANLAAAQALVPQLDDEQAQREFVFRLRTVLDASQASGDDGSLEFFTREPQELFASLGEPVRASLAAALEGGATGVGDGGAAGVRDLLDGVQAAARRLANFTTYYEMKQRAGRVGQMGLGPVLRRLLDRKPDIRLHLVGHSFGGRLVTAAAHTLPPGTPRCTVSLLQAAFSHNALSADYDGRRSAGAFRDLVARWCVSGPILITHTKNDRAVGVAYPLASRLARDQAAALGDQDDPYGGMGRNGARHTDEVDPDTSELLAVGARYALAPQRVYNLRADGFIADHGDVAGHEVAYAVLHAAAAV